ncbi:ABC transporter permease subunit [Streptomyces sp. NPDC057582]|uniref:ABC transporter permease subunit n=1 Tax=Streptomyces sp. NPDC057582 TaxID=3346174 RepID=UPI00368FA7D4
MSAEPLPTLPARRQVVARPPAGVAVVATLRRHLGLTITLVMLAVFFGWPLVDIALRSVTTTGMPTFDPSKFTWQNYQVVFTSSGLRKVMLNTVIVAGASALVVLVLAFPAAYLISRVSKRTAALLYALFFIPFFISILIRLFAFTQILSTNGPINQAFGAIGLGPYHLLFNRFATTLGMVSYLLPYAVLVMYAGMASVDPSLTTAAKVSGASNWQAFRRVYLPQVRSSVIGAVLLTFVMGLGFFLTPAILGGVDSTTVSSYISAQVQNFQWGVASAVGIVLLVATVVLFVAAIRISGLTTLVAGFGTGKGTSRQERLRFSPLSVGLWIVTVIGLIVLIVPALFVFPIAVQQSNFIVWPPSGFTFHWYAQALEDLQWSSAIFKSFRVGLVSMALAVVLGFLAARALLKMRRQSARSAFSALVYAPMVVPIILLAVGSYGPMQRMGLLGTDFGLAASQAMLALPFTATTFLASLGGLDRRVEQASWTLGASAAITTRRVIVPLILPSVIGAALLGFVNSWDEPVIALFQSQGSDSTLPVLIFSFVKSGPEPTIAAVGSGLIVLVVLAYIGPALLRRRGKRPNRRAGLRGAQ